MSGPSLGRWERGSEILWGTRLLLFGFSAIPKNDLFPISYVTATD